MKIHYIYGEKFLKAIVRIIDTKLFKLCLTYIYLLFKLFRKLRGYIYSTSNSIKLTHIL